ncbi:metal-dependent hydrolase [Natrinema sp. 1APR25-10V2]|uniref:metal-dependent hydrolase n=1 Tax=Natrinema sp. 1APR25-10V2 TaxID=2951081 RepID=UPI0028755040|nr:metal-dependent hydrolase [Natrinema sp. 1APR25-10V2]MDS0474975.1 metal-dependent hydrolase [Natrinema sp. 1APR25-10V2]
MVDVTGHLGMALLFAAPAWIVWGRRAALGFTGFALLTAMLPDTDLILQGFLPVTHHGVTHTVVFVVMMSILAGVFAARWLTAWLNAHRWIRSTEIAAETVFIFATTGLVVGGTSHLFADILSAPDIAAPLEPLWPFYREPIIVDVIYYDSPIWNFGLIAVAIGLHLVLARYRSYPLDTRYRIGNRTGGDSDTTRRAAGDQFE